MTSILPNTKPYHRMEHYREFVDAIAKKAGLDHATLQIDEIFDTSCASRPVFDQSNQKIKNVIRLNMTYLIKAADIPKRFVIETLDDQKIHSQKFINEAVTWVNKYFQIPHLSQPISRTQKIALLLLFYGARNPERLEKSRKWVIVHEIGHLVLKHHQMRTDFRSYHFKEMVISSVLATIPFALLYWGGFNPLLGALSLPLLHLKQGETENQEFALCRRQEYEADAYSVKILQDKEGALYQWQTRICFDRVFFPDRELEKVNPTSTHPPLMERLKKVESLTI